MAFIRSIEPGTQSIRAHTSEVDCFVQTVQAPDGSTRLHLTTFGSDNRKAEAKSSQSIQVDERAARELIKHLREAFPRLT